MMLKSLIEFKKVMVVILNWLLIATVLLLVLTVVWGVFTRSLGAFIVWLAQNNNLTPCPWLPGGQARWTEELARFLLVWVALIGGAVAFGTKGHLGVDYFVGKFHPEARKLLAVFSHICVLFFAGAIFVYGGGMMVHDSLAVEQMTPALNWKMGHVYMALPIAGIFMILFTIENLIENLITPAAQLHEDNAAPEVKQ